MGDRDPMNRGFSRPSGVALASFLALLDACQPPAAQPTADSSAAPAQAIAASVVSAQAIPTVSVVSSQASPAPPGSVVPGEAGVVAITLRSLDVARRFPQEVPENVLRKGAPATCERDGHALAPVVITTFGWMGKTDVWRAYPLAMDGWQCPVCGAVEGPALLAPAPLTALLERGAAAAQRGDLDEGEFYFRRFVSSQPQSAAGRLNLGSIYLDRARLELDRPGSNPAEVRRYRDVAIDQFERALRCSPPPPQRVSLMLADVYLRTGQREKARRLLTAYVADPAADPALRTRARSMLAE
jgi:hypothetical protein